MKFKSRPDGVPSLHPDEVPSLDLDEAPSLYPDEAPSLDPDGVPSLDPDEVQSGSSSYTPLTVALYLNDHYLNVHDTDFVHLVTADVDHYLKRASVDRVLVFPPVDSYYRLLIHKTVEEFPQVCSFSIGEGDERRTVVSLQESVLRAIQMDEWGRVSDSVEKVQKTVAMKQDRWGHGSFNDHDQSRTTSRGRGRGRGSRKLEEARPEGLPRGRWEHDDRDEPPPGDRLRQSAREDVQQADKKTTRKKNKHADIQVYVPRAKRVQYENPSEYAMCADEALHAEGPRVNVQETNISRLEESPLVGAGVTTGRTPPEKPPSGRKPRKARPAIELYDPHSKRKEREKVRAGKSHDDQLEDGEIDSRSHDVARMESDQWEDRELGQRLTTVDDIVTDQWESSFTEAKYDNQKLNESERLQYTREAQNDRHHHRRHSKKKKLKDKEKEEVPCDSERTEKHHKSKHKQKDGEERRRSHSKEHKERRRSKHKHSGNDVKVEGQHDQDKQGQVRGQIQGSQEKTEQTDYQSFHPGAVCDVNNQGPIEKSLTSQDDIPRTNQMDINSPVSPDMLTDICAEFQGECVSQTHIGTPQLVESMELGADQCSDDVNSFCKNVNEISSKEEYSDHGSENEPKDELLISTAGSGITSSEVDQLNSMTDPISNADPNEVGGFIGDTLAANLTKTVSDVENISDNMVMLSSGSESILNESSSDRNQAVEFTEPVVDDHCMDVQMTNETTHKCEEIVNSVIYEPSQQNKQFADCPQENLNSGEEDISLSQPFTGADQSKKCSHLDNSQLNTAIHMIETQTDQSGATTDMNYNLSAISGEIVDVSAVSPHINPADVGQSGIKSPAVTNQSEPSTHQSSEEAEMNEPESFTNNHLSEGLSQNTKVISQSQTSSHTAEMPNSHSEFSTGTDEISDTNISSLPPEPAVQLESPVQNCLMEVSQSEIQVNPVDQSQSIKSLDTIDQSQSITLPDDTIDQSESTAHLTNTMIPSKSLLQPSDITSQSNPSLQTDSEIIQSNLSLQSATDAEIIQPNPALRTESEISQSNLSLLTDGEINHSNPSLLTDGEINQSNPSLQNDGEISQPNPSLQTESETSQRNSSLQADGEITQSNLLLQTDGENNQSEIAQEQTEPQSLSLARCVTPPSTKSQSSLVAEAAAEDEDEDSWDKLYDDSGEALDSKLMNELTTAVGKVEIQKPQFDYLSYMPKDVDMDYDAYGHLLEIYDFPTNLITRDLVIAFKEFQDAGFDIKWVDDNHAIGIFSSNFAARSALTLHHPLIKVRPLSEATRPTKLKAKRACEFLQPYKPRPEMVATVARNLVAGALGLRSSVPKEKRDEEKRKIKEAKEKKRQARHDKKGAWDGTIGKCAMDDS